MRRLYLPIGMIGSGKSTWAREFIKSSNAKVVAGDDIRYMVAGGDRYEYNEILEPVIIETLLAITKVLLQQDYDVILDECYCSLSTAMRLKVASRFNKSADLIAVVFPEKDMKDRIEDKVTKELRGKSVTYWKRVFREMAAVYEPLDSSEDYFDAVLNHTGNP